MTHLILSQSGFNEDWAYGLLAIGILFIIMAMFSLGRGRKKRAATRDTARDHVDRARQKQHVRDELEALMVDINRMAKDLGAQLDAKVVRIEEATRQADERIAQLEALKQTLAEPDPYGNPPAVAPPADTLQAPADAADPLTSEVYALADQGVGPQDIAAKLNEHVGKVELILALRTG